VFEELLNPNQPVNQPTWGSFVRGRFYFSEAILSEAVLTKPGPFYHEAVLAGNRSDQ